MQYVLYFLQGTQIEDPSAVQATDAGYSSHCDGITESMRYLSAALVRPFLSTSDDRSSQAVYMTSSAWHGPSLLVPPIGSLAPEQAISKCCHVIRIYRTLLFHSMSHLTHKNCPIVLVILRSRCLPCLCYPQRTHSKLLVTSQVKDHSCVPIDPFDLLVLMLRRYLDMPPVLA